MIDSRLAFAPGKVLDESMDIYQADSNVKNKMNIGTPKAKKDISFLSLWTAVQQTKKQDFKNSMLYF
ncbi:unnamed protein product [Caenorhabditis nigoni]